MGSNNGTGLRKQQWDSASDWMQRDAAMVLRKRGLRWWLHKTGFHYKVEYELVEGYDTGTTHIPDWALRAGSDGIVGTWRLVRRRLYLARLPISRWEYRR